MFSTLRHKTLTPLHHHGGAVSQPVDVFSPVQSALFHQRRIMCFDEELSHEGYTNNTGDTGFFPRPTECDPVQFKRDSAVVFSAPSLEVDGDNRDSGSNDMTTALDGCFLQCEEDSIGRFKSPSMQTSCGVEHKAGAGSGSNNMTTNSVSCTNQRAGQAESPKLVHEAVMQVKNMTSTEAANLPKLQKSRVDETSPGSSRSQPSSLITHGERIPKMAAGVIPEQHCQKGEESELVSVCTVDTVTLWRSEDESFGLDLEITSSPLKVAITGLKPGGAAERVCVITSIVILVQYQ